MHLRLPLSLQETSLTTTKEERRGSAVALRRCWLHSLVLCTIFATEELAEQASLTPRCHTCYGLYHVNVGSEPLVGFGVWSEYFSVYAWIYCICACVCGLGSELNAECQGKPKPPSFSSCPSLTSLFYSFSVICLSLLLALSAIWPQRTDL